ncbi:MAG: outer membrane beta-barrel protein [Steroidobacteraceae bacterium]
MPRSTAIAALLLGLAPLAQAADNGIYLGAGYVQSDYGLSNPGIDDFDDEDSGFKLIAGFRPFDSFGVELNYTDHGEVTNEPNCGPGPGIPCLDTRLGAETIAGYAVGFLDFPVIDLFAKVGAASWQVDGNDRFGGSINEDDFDFAWGAGVQAHIWSLAARLEYEQIKLVDDELETISLSFIYTFL